MKYYLVLTNNFLFPIVFSGESKLLVVPDRCSQVLKHVPALLISNDWCLLRKQSAPVGRKTKNNINEKSF